jgi:hypothetical protein
MQDTLAAGQAVWADCGSGGDYVHSFEKANPNEHSCDAGRVADK